MCHDVDRSVYMPTIRRMDISALPARERILVTSHDLFYRDGIRATGIDRVIATSGVTKVTFYRHFPVEGRPGARVPRLPAHARWMAWFVDALGRRGAHERAGDAGALVLLADVMAEWFADPVFRGCAFINATAEVGGSVEGALERSREHKREMVEVIAGLLPSQLPARMALAQSAGHRHRRRHHQGPDGRRRRGPRSRRRPAAVAAGAGGLRRRIVTSPPSA
jgi:hypothetical protein